jgi:hypothetical protein
MSRRSQTRRFYKTKDEDLALWESKGTLEKYGFAPKVKDWQRIKCCGCGANFKDSGAHATEPLEKESFWVACVLDLKHLNYYCSPCFEGRQQQQQR